MWRHGIAVSLLAFGAYALPPANEARANPPRSSVALIAPGMTQTDLQSVMGPADYIQANGRRQAWQFCPRYFERLFSRRVDLWVTLGRIVSFREDLYVTVWFEDGLVRYMRVWPERGMGSCKEFYAAFRWEDPPGEDFFPGALVHDDGAIEDGLLK